MWDVSMGSMVHKPLREKNANDEEDKKKQENKAGHPESDEGPDADAEAGRI